MSDTIFSGDDFKKQITKVYVGMLIYLIVEGIADNLLKMIPDPTGIVPGALGIIVSLLVLKLVFRKDFTPVSYAKGETKMTGSKFFYIFCVFCIFLLIGSCMQNLIELVFSLFGLSSTGRLLSMLESMLVDSTAWNVLGVVVAAPIAEELLCRGFVLHGLKSWGKKFAIILSALLFAMMHGNIIQGVNTFVMGLMLGYVAMEYSIIWSMVLHFLNNGVLTMGIGALLAWINPNMSGTVAKVIVCGIQVILAVIGIVLMVRNKRVEAIRAYAKENRTENGVWKQAFLNVLFILAALVTIALSIMMIGPA